MINLRVVRQSMTKWDIFLTACIVVAGLLLKIGAPFFAVVVGVGLAAFVNWTGRRTSTTAETRVARAHEHPAA